MYHCPWPFQRGCTARRGAVRTKVERRPGYDADAQLPQPNQDADDRDDDEEFNQCETADCTLGLIREIFHIFLQYFRSLYCNFGTNSRILWWIASMAD
jgi:hypothetical protein